MLPLANSDKKAMISGGNLVNDGLYIAELATLYSLHKYFWINCK